MKTQTENMEQRLSRLLFAQLRTLDLFTNEPATPARLKERIGWVDLYDRWFAETLATLCRDGLIERIDDGYRLDDRVSIDAEAEWRAWDASAEEWSRDPLQAAQVHLVATMLRALPEILTGTKPATDVMFPDASMRLVEGVYKGNPISDYFNEVLAETVVAYLRSRIELNPETRLRILEVGAGTGGTTAMLLEKLADFHDYLETYTYTDISPAFLMHAREHFAPGNPFLKTAIFDVERPPAGQGFALGDYDLVIAANVLHATRNIRVTLGHVHDLLAKNGLLLLNELSDKNLFGHLTFGLLEGWWLYEDPELRMPGSPGLYPRDWARVLGEEGFGEALFPAEAAAELGQQVIVAESDGILREAQATHERVGSAVTSSQSPVAPPTARPVSAGDERLRERVANAVRDMICAKISESLEVPVHTIDPDEPFAAYGIDSITGVKLVGVLNEAMGLALDTTTLFDHSSVRHLAAFVAAEYQDDLVTRFDLDTDRGPAQDEAPPPQAATVRAVEVDTRSLRDFTEASNDDGRAPGYEPIAVIGMSGRFAKSQNLAELWDHLAAGDELIEEVSRWDLSPYFEEGAAYCSRGSFLDGIDQFDPLFFNISGTEATYMDPQQRLFLEEAWNALEHAGYAGADMDGRHCGVYVGVCGGDYQTLFEGNPPPQAFWGNSAAVVPARLAFYLNLKGPAVAVDTACSSGLVAIHVACQGLWRRETEMAVAGGVNVQSTSAFYRTAGSAGMLSADGRCYAFDDRANGFVPGEGVGVVVLKRLSDAMRDGDHLIGVIRGSGLNQDGFTNGITAPSAKSQAALERQVYETFDIHPEQIQMVEAHGTGTKLGDPIEYGALTRAFRKSTDKRHFCALGSIKSNLGHTIGAAGVAGALKILLSLQHRQIPPSLNYETGNRHIQFEDSPFFVNTELRDWEVPEDARAPAKRRAVVSSFGFSGTNCHMVFEEAPERTGVHRAMPEYLVVLSGRTADQLRDQVARLKAHVASDEALDLGNTSFTLLLGRRHFGHRWACLARDREELLRHLEDWLAQKASARVFSNTAKDQGRQKAFEQYGNHCIGQCREEADPAAFSEHLGAVADLYCQGYSLSFAALFEGGGFRRVPLPTYAYGRQRFWVDATDVPAKGVEVAEGPGREPRLHPLLHANTSTLREQRFTTHFDGSEFFLRDHLIQGYMILPGVAHLEMVRAAVQRALGWSDPAGGEAGRGLAIRFRNVLWLRPVAVGEGLSGVYHVGLEPDEGGLRYRIYSLPEGADEVAAEVEPVVHSQGVVVIEARDADEQRLDLRDLQGQCDRAELDAGPLYQAFRKIGITHGESLRSIREVRLGERRVLARLTLPEIVNETIDELPLHPSQLDSALQSILGLTVDLGKVEAADTEDLDLKPSIPFALKDMVMLAGCTREMWAWVRPCAEDSGDGDSRDIDLCDAEGRVCVQMRGFTPRVFDAEGGDAGTSETSTILLDLAWQDAPASGAEGPEYGRRIALVAGLDERVESLRREAARRGDHDLEVVVLPGCAHTAKPSSREFPSADKGAAGSRLARRADNSKSLGIEESDNSRGGSIPPSSQTEARLSEVPITKDNQLGSRPTDPPKQSPEKRSNLVEGDPGIADHFTDDAVKVMRCLQDALKQPTEGPTLVQILVPESRDDSLDPRHLWAGLVGMLRTARLEHGKLVAQVVLVDAAADAEALLDRLDENRAHGVDVLVRYRDDRRQVQAWREIEPPREVPLPWRDGGAYLITGGLGGLGVLFTDEIVARCEAPKLILTGRSALDDGRRTLLENWQRQGAEVVYLQVDVTRKADVDRLVEEARERFGGLNGVLHSAGILGDCYLAQKQEGQFRDVMAPKITGTVNLDHACRDLELDFFVTFSSMAAPMGNPGQTDYGTANAFMDLFAPYRNRQVAAGLRFGRTFSINWPLWADGGMTLDPATEEVMKRTIGMVGMRTANGLKAFNQMLAGERDNLMVLEGDMAVMRRVFLQQAPAPSEPAESAVPEPVGEGDHDLLETVRDIVVGVVSELVGMPAGEIDGDTEFPNFGFDSLMLTDFSNKLAKSYQLDIMPTVFFEHTTVNRLARYLMTEYRAAFTQAGTSVARPSAGGAAKVVETPPSRTAATSGSSAILFPDRTMRFGPVRAQSQAADASSRAGAVDLAEPIAIVGVSGRFPMAEDLATFWRNLHGGKHCISEVPPDRWDWKALWGDPATEPNKCNIKWGGFMDGVGEFDPLFFGISPKEAEWMDPQQRLLMSYVWLAIEDAGYSARSLSGSRLGILVGTSSSGYGSVLDPNALEVDTNTTTGMVPSVGPNRMSFFLNVHGPSEPIETACSSSLVAIHRAVQAIRNGDCDAAIAGGVNTLITPVAHIGFNKAGMLAFDGRCKTFSAQADGYVRGEGVGMIFLKKLSAAEADGDHIYAVVRGTAVNHGGRANSLTAPNPTAQAELLKTAYSQAGIDPRTVGYIEAHGTGTELGDPIEINGLKSAFRDLYREAGAEVAEKTHCGLGSVKTNIGHLELAAGIAGIIKVLLQMKHRTLVESLHCREVNPYIDLKGTPFYIVRERQAWAVIEDENGKALPRRAGVSSFGIGGANAHVILEEYAQPRPAAATPVGGDRPQMVVLSAKTRDRLVAAAAKLLRYLEDRDTDGAGDLDATGPVTPPVARLTELLAEVLAVDPSDIDPDQPLEGYGVDHLKQVQFVEKVQQAYLDQMDTHELMRFGSVAAMAAHLASELGRVAPPPAEPPEAVDLASLAYTLQVGREAMEERFAVIVASSGELREKLKTYVEAEGAPDGPGIRGAGIFLGQVRKNRQSVGWFSADEDLATIVETWMQKGKYSKLLDLWVQGLDVPWARLHTEGSPRRLSLPTYPFAKERYWLSAGDAGEEGAGPDLVAAALHPLVQRNVSDLAGQRFLSVFDGEEFFLRDHIMGGRKMLPGVAYLEMARAAAAHSTDESVVALRNVVWKRPLVVEDGEKPVVIDLYAESDRLHFGVASRDEASAGDASVVHCEGELVLGSSAEPRPERRDLASIRPRLTRTFGKAEFYAYLEGETRLGDSFQGIAGLHRDECEVLAELQLPDAAWAEADAFTLHPTIMDAAFQIATRLVMERHPFGMHLPFCVKEVRTWAPTPLAGFAHVRPTPGSDGGSGTVSYDIDLLDERGEVCVAFRGFLCRDVASANLVTMVPEWRPRDLVPTEDCGATVVLVDGAAPRSLVAALAADTRFARVASLPARTDRPTAAVVRAIFDTAFDVVRERFRIEGDEPQRVLVLAAAESDPLAFAPLVGLLKSAGHEYRKLRGKVVAIEDLAGIAAERVRALLAAECADAEDAVEVRYRRDGSREVRQLAELKFESELNLTIEPGGVYWITGGFGKLGLMLADYLTLVTRSTIVLSGRTALDDRKTAELVRLSARGSSVSYVQVDVSQPDEVLQAVARIRREQGRLTGVFHCAGLIRDALIANKTRAEIDGVFAAKVDAVLNLDEATRDEPLSFLALYSSLAAVFGNAGQTDYAAANAFLDAFAAHRNELVRAGRRSGHTASFNWSLWQGGGMRMSASAERAMSRSTGIRPLSMVSGMRALFGGLARDVPQLIVMEGEREKIRRTYLEPAAPKTKMLETAEVVAEARPPQGGRDDRDRLDRVKAELKTAIAAVLKVPVQRIQQDADLVDYGMDSIGMTDFAQKLNRDYDLDLSPGDLFEHTTLGRMAAFLARRFPARFGSGSAAPSIAPAATDPPLAAASQATPSTSEAAPAWKRIRRPVSTSRSITPAAVSERHQPGQDVAIVGMSGKFPEAEDVHAFWRNVKAGRNCIGQVPAERWDWRAFFGDPKKEPGKTRIKWGGFIDGVDEFDPLFFKISPAEAEIMDPQQRLLMTHVWSALEDAAIPPASLSDSPTGVFCATVGTSEYVGLGAMNPNNAMTMSAVAASLIPNRISFALDLSGPSEYCDTACSSSLVALHRAVLALQRGECEQAIVAAVNLLLSPAGFMGFEAMNYLSPEGRARSFQAGADGFVRSEGVGALVIKPLDRAVADGDPIYAVVKGTGVAHGGKGVSLTAANARGMRRAMAQAFDRARLDPRSIAYVEAHGIASPLADGVEIAALKGGYGAEASSQPEQAIYLSSLKPTIGHGELVSGLAALIKVVSALRDRCIPGIPEFGELGENCSLDGSPFRIAAENREWTRDTDDEGRIVPRRAAINSYGFGGVNAHVVLEEYGEEKSPTSATAAAGPFLLVFSARTEANLREMPARLLHWLTETEAGRTAALRDVAYTLQVGRQEMAWRLTFTARDRDDLLERLRRFETAPEAAEFLRGDGTRDHAALDFLDEDEELGEMIAKWVKKGKLDKVGGLWVRGFSVTWAWLYDRETVRPRRLHLPTYPFARQRYWAVATADEIAAASSSAGPVPVELHPLVQRNTSDFSTLRFSSTFTGEEFFLAEHRVGDRAYLPGVAYLEMVRAAVEQAKANAAADSDAVPRPIHIRDHAWAAPITVAGAPVTVHLILRAEPHAGPDHVRYEMLGEDRALHASGLVDLGSVPEPGVMDLAALQRRTALHRIDPERCYREFARLGIAYGPSFRCIEELQSGNGQVLARLVLPVGSADRLETFPLHPCLLDAALQAVFALDPRILLPESDQTGSSAVSTSAGFRALGFESVEMADACTPEMWAWVRPAENRSSRGDGRRRFHISLCDGHGKVRVRLEGFALGPIEPGRPDRAVAAPSDVMSAVDVGRALPSLTHAMRGHFPAIDGKVQATLKRAEGLYSYDMEELLFRLLCGNLRKMDLLPDPEARIAALKRRIGESFFYERWIRKSLADLVKAGYLRPEGRGYAVVDPERCDLETCWREWDAQRDEWLNGKHKRTIVPLVEATVRALPEVITGKTMSTDIMFPNGSMDLVAPLYRDNFVADLFNEVLVDSVVAYIEERLAVEPDARIRLIEIGAGSGGTTEGLLPRLEPFGAHIAEYCFTDISKAFLFYAEKRYRPKYDFLKTEMFDVGRCLTAQAIEPNRYDLAIATNVLHATKDIRETLRVSKAVLRQNGLLLLNELSDNFLFTHLTMGLLQGWWMHEDPELRIAGSPVLAPDSWDEVLKEEGYGPILFPAEAAHGLGQQVVVAASDGRVDPAQLGGTDRSETAPPAAPRQPPPSPRPTAGAGRVVHARTTAGAAVGQSREAGVAVAVPVSDAAMEARVREVIVANMEASLKVPRTEIDVEASFASFGLDSITGINLVDAVNDELGIELKTTSLFDYSSVAKLTEFIVSEFGARLRAPVESPATSPPRHEAAAPEVPPSPPPAVPDEAAPSLRHQVAALIVDHLATSLKVPLDQIDPAGPFADYGLDSITGVNLVDEINAALEIELKTISLFDHSTVERLTDFILTTFGDRVRSALAKKDLAPESPLSERATRMRATRMRATRMRATRIPVQTQTMPKAPSLPESRSDDRVVHPEPSGIEATGESPAVGTEAIAVIGMSGRFAKSDDLNALWAHLAAGDDLVEQVRRWDLAAHFGEAGAEPDFCRTGSYLEDIRRFDPHFFNISEGEATYMDPQQRLFLEESWKALEDAGYAGDGVSGCACGIYVGCTQGGYGALLREEPHPAAFPGNAGSIMPARLAYHLNLHGPAVAVDTACSSSLTAIHLACQGLWCRETDMALAGGVFVQASEGFHLSTSQAGMLSPHGHCRSFDDRADGFVPGEGAGVVVLKRLSDALADGDQVHGVIRASGLNQDGTTNGIMAPSANAQERLLRQVYDRFGIDAGSIQMVEAHGTGTRLGDAIEVDALTRAFWRDGDAVGRVALGSIKTNIGHTATAAGVAGVLKVLLSLRHRQIPPSLHFESGNGLIDFARSPFFVNTRLKDWDAPVSGAPRRATVSAFGFSGTNAHMVLEEAPRPVRRQVDFPAHLVVLSARTRDQLRAVVEHMLDYVLTHPHMNLGDAAFTLLVGRRHLRYRCAFVVADRAALTCSLQRWLDGDGGDAFVGEVVDRRTREADPDRGARLVDVIRKWRPGEDARDYRGMLSSLAELFVVGHLFDFEAMLADRGCMRMSLPTYPFDAGHYWVPEPPEPRSRGGRGGSVPTPDEKPPRPPVAASPSGTAVDAASMTEREPVAIAEAFLRHWVAAKSRVPIAEVSRATGFHDMGLQSIQLVRMVQDLGEALGVRLSPGLLFDYVNIAEFAAYLAEHYAARWTAWAEGERKGRVPLTGDGEPAPASSEDPAVSPNLPATSSPTRERAAPMRHPLSQGQMGLWALQRLAPEMTAYNCPFCFRLTGAFDVDKFREACAASVARFPLLTSVFGDADGEPFRVQLEPNRFGWDQVDLRDHDEAALFTRLKQWVREPFDVAAGPLLRFHLAREADDAWVVLMVVHHLVFDGTSSLVLFQNLWEAYGCLIEGGAPDAAGVVVDYDAFVAWERALLDGEEGRLLLDYWKDRLADDPPVVTLPPDRPRPARPSFRGRTHVARLDAALTRRVRAWAKEHRIQRSVFFLGVFQVLLHRYTGERDLLVGMPTSGRPGERFAEVVGYFINMIVVRGRLHGETSFRDFLTELRLAVVEGMDHAAYPFPALVRELGLGGERAVAPLFQVTYTFQNFIPDSVSSGSFSSRGLDMEMVDGLYQEGDHDFGLEVIDLGDEVTLHAQYDEALYRPETIERVMAHYLRLIVALLDDPDRPISRVAMLAPEERERLLHAWNPPRDPAIRERSCFELFAERAVAQADREALIFTGADAMTWSYAELHRRVGRLAAHLVRSGAARGTRVGVCLERSPEMVVALLAVFEAGCVFVPLDPQAPAAHLGQVCEDAQPGLVLVHGATRAKLETVVGAIAPCGLVDLDRDAWDRDPEGTEVAGRRAVDLQAPAYIIYTSGSTGRPKGVVVSHGALARHCQVIASDYGLGVEDRVLQFGALHVDIALEQILPGLMSGATIVVRDNALWSPSGFLQQVRAHRITVVDLPPRYLHELLLQWRRLPELETVALPRLVIVGGEALPAETVQLWLASPLASRVLLNAYGPTETTITSLVHRITPDTLPDTSLGGVPIGRPLPCETAFVLDDHGAPVPEGVVGELYIGGSGVAEGYLDRPGLTAERFVPNTFVREGEAGGQRLYRTGDMVRRLPGTDGLVDFLGRRDFQVKIRGFRLELGEIEARLCDHPAVDDAVVTLREQGGEPLLTAYLIVTGEGPSEADLRAYLEARLPSVMAPSAFVTLDRFPLNAAGKVDRGALPIPDAVHEPTATPRNTVEARLADLWREVLSTERIGVFDNFFEIGGHSLLAVRLVAAIQNAFGVALPLASVIRAPTIARQAPLVRSRVGEEAEGPLVRLAQGGTAPPLFLVHPVGGNVLCYMALAQHLSGERSCYGLQAPGLVGGDQPTDVAGMAAVYLEAMRSIQPEGPYYLGGWSLGGVIAYEMARQLAEAGEEAALLVLIDSYTPEMAARVAGQRRQRFDGEGIDPDILELIDFGSELLGSDAVTEETRALVVEADADRLFDHWLARAVDLGMIAVEDAAAQLRRWFGVYRTHVAAMNEYRPQPNRGEPMLLFLAREPFMGGADEVPAVANEPTGGWSRLAGGSLLIHKIAADHHGLMAEPHVAGLAELLRERLSQMESDVKE